ncbi:Nuclear pore complex protein like [Actinidia chinensis var. chinensis]|uniref:Nuclear pore complex protein like n=1 Tax=Actinidia chinensis var. chinensis TaxID=1590841 RepID=A0A2R6Q1R0_ACTCC|nr:Nuclear pore complex protein like [Actinidia chinensis var. chinensis]
MKFGSTSLFGQSSNGAFGSTSVFEQNSNASNNPFTLKPFGSTTPLGSPMGGSVFGGTSTGVFGANSSPLGQQPTFGSPALGSSSPSYGVFGQSSNGAFGSPSVFEQNSSASNNPFTPKPFGSTTPLGSPMGGSVFGGTSTGVFGANSSPLGQHQQPTFGSPALGSSSPSYGGSSTFGQKSGFGGFESTLNQSNSFGSGFQQTQTTFGSGPFGLSTSLGASTQNASGAFGGFGTGNALGAEHTSGASSNSAFGVPRKPAVGASNTTRFSFGTMNPSFGQSTSTTASHSLIGTGLSNFGIQSSSGAQPTTSIFGATGGGGGQHGGSRLAAYTATAEVGGGSGTQAAAKLQSISAMQVNKDKSHEELRCEDFQLGDKGGPHRVGQSAGGIGGGFNSSGSAPTLAHSSVSPFFPSTPSNLFSLQTSALAHSSVSPFFPSPPSNPFAPQTASNPFLPQTSSNQFTLQTSSNLCTPQTSSNQFSSTPSNPFTRQTLSTSFLSQTSSNPFTLKTCSNPFAPQTSSTSFLPQTSSNPFVTPQVPALSSSIFRPFTNSSITPPSSSSSLVASSPHLFGPFPSITNSNTASGTASIVSSGLSSASTHSSPTFICPSFSQPNIFSAPASGSQLVGNLWSSTSSPLSTSNPAGLTQTTFSFTTPLQPTQTAHTTGAFANSEFPRSSTGNFGLNGFVGMTGVLGQQTFNQAPATQSTVVAQATPNTSPFGALPAMPQLSIGHPGSAPSVRYGISSIPVADKPAAPLRMSSLLTCRHLSQRRIRAPARKYDPKSDGPKVPFFINDEENRSTPKADALFFPRENPRALVILPPELWPQRSSTENMSPLVRASLHVYENGKITAEVSAPALSNSSLCQEEDDLLAENSPDKEHVVDVEVLMPQLRRTDYYTQPQIHDLAVNERANPGFCSHVKDFVVGRHGYGSIKFLGETDVRKLDLDSHVQFNNREVIVYMDESKKPPVGQGLNKPAEVTLLNVKCINKKTGKQYINGPKVDAYREMLMKKATEQGAEFVSYGPVEGEWKFRVEHFSQYSF